MTKVRVLIATMVLLGLSGVIALKVSGQVSATARQKLEQQGIAFSEEAFVARARSGDAGVVKLFLDAGMNPNAKDARDEDGSTVLMLAAQAGHTAVAQELIRRGADLQAQNAGGKTALMLAAWRGHVEVLKTLLASGARLNTQDKSGATALFFAFSGHQIEAAQALLASKEIDVNVRRADGSTALMYAVALGNADIVRSLLNKGADANTSNKNGFTVLMFAASKGNLELVKALLDKRAKVDAQDKGRMTALLIAEEQGHADVVQALIEKGAGKKPGKENTWP